MFKKIAAELNKWNTANRKKGQSVTPYIAFEEESMLVRSMYSHHTTEMAERK